MCARPGVLTSKLAFHAPPPPLAPLPFPLPPPTRRPAGEGTKVGTYRPTARSCLWGILFACVGAAAGKEQAKVTIAICHLLPLSMDACANRPVAARVPLWEPTLSPSPSPNPHLIARNMGHQGSGTV